MSGHSHWSSIKHKKKAEDKRKSKIFSKLTRMITVAAREGGGDPDQNPKLRSAIEKAHSFDMPNENIERAIKRGTGELEGVKLEKVLFGAYGPGGIAILIEGITDNKNRTLNEIKQVLKRNQGKLAETDSVKWLFKKRGFIEINKVKKKEDLELKAIEAGAEDLNWRDSNLEVYTKAEELEEVKTNLEKKGINIDSSSIDWVAKKKKEASEKERKELEALFEQLDENDAVQEIYSNLKI